MDNQALDKKTDCHLIPESFDLYVKQSAAHRLGPHWIENFDEETYHADRTHINSGSFNKILKSQRKFCGEFFLQRPQEDNEVFHFGKLFHHAILEGDRFISNYAVMPEWTDKLGNPLNKNTNLYKGFKSEWLLENRGKTIITSKELEMITAMVTNVIGHKDAYALIKDGLPELTGFFLEPKTKTPCRIRIDVFNPKVRAIIDFKTSQHIARRRLSWSAVDYGYDLQLGGAYRVGASVIQNQPVDLAVMIVLQKEYPYECAVYPMHDDFITIGTSRFERACQTFKTCIETKTWKPYQEEMEPLAPPPSILQDFEAGAY